MKNIFCYDVISSVVYFTLPPSWLLGATGGKNSFFSLKPDQTTRQKLNLNVLGVLFQSVSSLDRCREACFRLDLRHMHFPWPCAAGAVTHLRDAEPGTSTPKCLGHRLEPEDGQRGQAKERKYIYDSCSLVCL